MTHMHSPVMLRGSRADTRPLLPCVRCGTSTTDLSGVRMGSRLICRICWTKRMAKQAILLAA